MRLLPVNTVADAACYLYALLLEREPYQNISHKAMPTVDEHLAFVRSNPYADWCLIEVDGDRTFIGTKRHIAGATYITRQREIGIFIFKKFRGNGYGKVAVKEMVNRHGFGTKIFANIAPTNERSRKMFEKLGFRLIQHTLEGPSQ